MREVVNIIDGFLEKNLLITYTKGEVEDWTQAYFSRVKPHPNYPIVILIRNDSASGSEMLAGALKAHGRALIVGETSFGKGSGQTLIRLEKANPKRWLRLTIFKYYLPDETSIHEKGVKPDIEQKPDQFQSWEYDWQLHLSRAGLIEDYVAEHYEKNKAAFFRIADFDGFDASAYPEFDALFERALRILYDARRRWTRDADFPSFETFRAQHETAEDRAFIRVAVRAAVRRKVQDDRARPFIQDFQEDVQLQRAIREVLKKLERDPGDIPEFKHFAKKFE
jgi:hypothetical protein